MVGHAELTRNQMTQPEVIAIFTNVKRVYFTRWDKGNRWKAQFAGHELCRGATGYCDSKTKTIFLNDSVCGMINAGVGAFLIHEICHDVGAAGHGQGGARRMEMVARQAVARGEHAVAKLLRNDIYSYCDFAVHKLVIGSSARPSMTIGAAGA